MNYEASQAATALEILLRLLPAVSSHREYVELVEVASDSSRWDEAHEVFGRIRRNITLPNEASSTTDADSIFAYVAENAAKTIYNCSHPITPFDEDNLEWLLKCEKEFLAAIDEVD